MCARCKDPCDYVTAHGGDAFRERIAEAIPLVEYVLARVVARELGLQPQESGRTES